MKIFVRRITLLHWSGVSVKEANHQDQKKCSCGVLNNKFIMIKVGNRNWLGQAPCQSVPVQDHHGQWSPSNETTFQMHQWLLGQIFSKNFNNNSNVNVRVRSFI